MVSCNLYLATYMLASRVCTDLREDLGVESWCRAGEVPDEVFDQIGGIIHIGKTDVSEKRLKTITRADLELLARPLMLKDPELRPYTP